MEALTAWLLTYALHSTLLLGAAWLLCRRLDRRALPAQALASSLTSGLGSITSSSRERRSWSPQTAQMSLGF